MIGKIESAPLRELWRYEALDLARRLPSEVLPNV